MEEQVKAKERKILDHEMEILKMESEVLARIDALAAQHARSQQSSATKKVEGAL